VRERGDFSLEDAVWQLTGRQAEVFGITDRGTVEVGAVADLVVFSLDEIHWDDDEFVGDLPGGALRMRRPDGGFRATIVNGVVAQAAGTITDARPGRMLDVHA
jgi:N-acyl-D-aspartate/D-glutamate deacylase